MTKAGKLALIFLAAVAAACCAFLLLRPQERGTVAVIRRDGVVLREIDLSELDAPLTFTVEGENGLWNTVTAQPGRVRVESAGCPDQICVHQGWISDTSVPIVCLPNKLVIEISGGEAELDAVVQ